MSMPSAHTQLVAQLAEQILNHPERAVDGILRRSFKEHPQMGSGDRRRVSDRLYLLLRHLRRFNGLHTGQPYLPACEARALLPLVQMAEQALSEGLPPRQPQESDGLYYSLPDWLWQAWCEQYGQDAAQMLAAAMLEQAPVDLRVNRQRASREGVAQRLLESGVESAPLAISADGLRLTKRHLLRDHPVFLEGLAEIQDGGSQCIAPLLQPVAGQLLVDFCAGGGGKTVHLAALMQNKGRILALDTQEHRLKRLAPRLKRNQIKMVQSHTIRHERDPWLSRWYGKADGVLVDAPCSGSGTLRRHPEIKWQLEPGQVGSLAIQQGALLEGAAHLVKRGGRLVYATCSLLAQENEEVVEAFLRTNRGFRLEEIQGLGDLQRLATPYLKVMPQQAQTDGFFSAVLIRT
ncbi:Fmu (Sun) domain protein [Magnetococcus marinus MC-1]|uniref:Fmu (Sun) domain protein n=1 Tax=Magnetococcus marinus (strain ATCC BAA-1437 / JCM 17883 / MC-1) TaxID=156889 RepID=A0LDB1_MAGMM|nr:RsmB/NOP family class I SAM-dependent RNA methyltransferase [Magnetococcus marinus]ABK45954.1 Fmu (Sun) domain protein [Magnetococcus marinus MC-1]